MGFVSMKPVSGYVGGMKPPIASLPNGQTRPKAVAAAKPKTVQTESAFQMALRIFGNHCFYCGLIFYPHYDPHRTYDHFIPRSRGGKRKGNLVPACRNCNARKKDDLPTAEQVAKFKVMMGTPAESSKEANRRRLEKIGITVPVV